MWYVDFLNREMTEFLSSSPIINSYVDEPRPYEHGYLDEEFEILKNAKKRYREKFEIYNVPSSSLKLTVRLVDRKELFELSPIFIQEKFSYKLHSLLTIQSHCLPSLFFQILI